MDKYNYDQIVFAIVAISILFVLMVSLILLIAFIYQKRKQNHKAETLALKNEFSQTLLQSQLEIQEQTLNTISQELHDNIGQVLSITKLTVSSINLDKQDDTTQKLTTTKNLINKAIADIKDLSNILNNDKAQDIGLIKSVENLVDIFSKNKIPTHLIITGNICILDNKVELILYRIVQECMQNIVKHSSASQINITINYTNNNCSIAIQDNGKGFDVNDTFNKGIGLKNIESRVKILNGKLNIESSSNGTLVEIVV